MKLFPHQIADAQLMAAGDLPNFSAAGTGKTGTVLEAIRLGRLKGGVIVAPPIALLMWKAEIERHLGATAQIVPSGVTPLKVESDFLVMSYAIAASKQKLAVMEWAGKFGSARDSVLVCDESHYIKTHTSKRAMAVMGHAGTGRGGLFDAFGVYYPMTGTPITRYPDDLWMQLRAAFGEEFRKAGVATYDNFVRQFCVVTKKQFHPRSKPMWVVSAAKNEPALHELLYRDIGCIRRTMDEVEHSMPELTYRDIFIKVGDDRQLRSFDADSEEAEGMGEMLHLLGDLKARPTAEYVADLGKQVLIGYHHTSVGDALVDELRKHGTVARVMGGMSLEAKEAVRVAFNAGNVRYLVGQVSAMNTAWNLQESGHHVVVVEDNFSPSVIEQFVKRVWRIGQGRHVQVDMIKSQYKLDDLVTRVRMRKEASNLRTVG